MDTQQTIAAAEGDFLSANDELIQELAAFEAGETYFVRRGACSNLALVEQESSSSKGEAPRTLPVATPARAAAPVPDIQEISEVPEVPPTEASFRGHTRCPDRPSFRGPTRCPDRPSFRGPRSCPDRPSFRGPRSCPDRQGFRGPT